MTASEIIYQVDAFSSEPFRGNPAGVCILKREPSEEWMQNIASEIHVSETAFISGGGEEYQIRFFTPESEIPLCGHATLASAHIMFETGIVPSDKEIRFLSKAGELKIRSAKGWIIMEFPAYELQPIPVPPDFISAIGILPDELYRTTHGWTIALIANEEEVINLRPDFKAMRNSEFGTLIVTSTSSDPLYDFCVRCFVPALGIDEDPVTGSAHCALVPFWHKKTGRTNFTSHQVSKRGGILRVALTGDKVEIAGQAKTILKGELFV